MEALWIIAAGVSTLAIVAIAALIANVREQARRKRTSERARKILRDG